jgi:hypothetical protein
MGRPVYRVDTRCQFARPDSRFACLQVIESPGRLGRSPGINVRRVPEAVGSLPEPVPS